MEKSTEAIPKEFLQTLKLMNQDLLYTKPMDPSFSLHQSFILESVSKEPERHELSKHTLIKSVTLINSNLFSNTLTKERIAQRVYLLIIESKAGECLVSDIKTIGFTFIRAKKIHEVFDSVIINNLLNPTSVLKLPVLKSATVDSLECNQHQAVTLLSHYMRIFEAIETLQNVVGLKLSQSVRQTAAMFFEYFEAISDDLDFLNKKEFVLEYCGSANGLENSLPNKQNKRAILNALILILIKM